MVATDGPAPSSSPRRPRGPVDPASPPRKFLRPMSDRGPSRPPRRRRLAFAPAAASLLMVGALCVSPGTAVGAEGRLEHAAVRLHSQGGEPSLALREDAPSGRNAMAEASTRHAEPSKLRGGKTHRNLRRRVQAGGWRSDPPPPPAEGGNGAWAENNSDSAWGEGGAGDAANNAGNNNAGNSQNTAGGNNYGDYGTYMGNGGGSSSYGTDGDHDSGGGSYSNANSYGSYGGSESTSTSNNAGGYDSYSASASGGGGSYGESGSASSYSSSYGAGGYDSYSSSSSSTSTTGGYDAWGSSSGSGYSDGDGSYSSVWGANGGSSSASDFMNKLRAPTMPSVNLTLLPAILLLLLSTLTGMLLTAHRMEHDPEGTFANCCRVSLHTVRCIGKVMYNLYHCRLGDIPQVVFASDLEEEEYTDEEIERMRLRPGIERALDVEHRKALRKVGVEMGRVKVKKKGGQGEGTAESMQR